VPIDFEVDDKIATITINRPEALNAMSPDMYARLSECWLEVRDNPDIWVAIVSGAPQPERPPERQVFSAGADLRNMARGGDGGGEPGAGNYRFWQTQEGQILNRGLEVWKPIVAAVNGLCLAGGMTLLLATDIRVASEHAMFDLSEVKRGILPGNGGTQRTIRQLPYPIAMEVLLLGRRLSAERAAHFGLINEVVPHDQLMDVARERARELRGMAPLAVRAIKELSVRAQYMPLGDGLRMEEAIAARLRATEDAREGPRAFAEKREPEFRGR
jgi:E-phenylitaconyl-CoA hydratase